MRVEEEGKRGHPTLPYPVTKPFTEAGGNGVGELKVKRHTLTSMLLQRSARQVPDDAEPAAKVRRTENSGRRGKDAGSGIRKFTDLGSIAKRPVAPAGTEVDMAGALRRIESNHLIKSKARRGPATGTAEAGRGEGGECSAASPPLDWGLKSSIRFTAAGKLGWAKSMPLSVENDALNSFCGTPGNADAREEAMIDTSAGQVREGLLRRFRESTLSWLHPNEQFTPAVLSAMNAESALGTSETFLQERRMQWRRSFRSLYHALRAGSTPMFYLTCPECIAFFCDECLHRQVRGPKATGICLILHHERAGIRNSLKESGVEFQPLSDADRRSQEWKRENDPDDDNDNDYDEKAKELQDFSTRKITKGALFCEGYGNVHAAFDVLFNYLASHGMREDVPQLISPNPFVGASIASAKVRSGPVQRVGRDGQMEQLEFIEVKGLVAPWTVQRLAASMEEFVDAFDVALGPLPGSTTPYLNMACGRMRAGGVIDGEMAAAERLGTGECADKSNRGGAACPCPPKEDRFRYVCSLYSCLNVEDSYKARELTALRWDGSQYDFSEGLGSL